jgi:hypothetical protein
MCGRRLANVASRRDAVDRCGDAVHRPVCEPEPREDERDAAQSPLGERGVPFSIEEKGDAIWRFSRSVRSLATRTRA